MEKTNFTSNLRSIARSFSGKKQLIKSLFLLPALLFLFGTTANSQCTVVVNDQINVGLNGECQAVLSIDHFLEGETLLACPGFWTVEIYSGALLVERAQNLLPTIPLSGVVLDGFVLDTEDEYELIGQNFMFVVTNVSTGNNQMGFVLVEDKTAPTIDCVESQTYCYNAEDFLPEAADNCSDVTVNLVRILPDLPGDCGNSILTTQRRIYQAVDASGNVSPVCTMSIEILRIVVEDVEFPANDTLSCAGTYELDANGNPHPSVSGVPFITDADSGDVYNLFPNSPDCNLQITYTDLEIPGCGTSKTIRRMWSATEWCDGEQQMAGKVQFINIINDVNPFFTNCPTEPLTMSTGYLDCNVSVGARSLGIEYSNEEGCSPVVQVTAIVIGGNSVSNLLDPAESDELFLTSGENLIRYIAYDACNNTDTCEFIINVEDHVFPVAVCKQFTTVSLNNYGEGSVYATSLDNGSWDNCGIASIETRRMNPSACDPTPTFGEKIDFCCSDVGEPIQVILRVTDLSGNVNECMVNVQVQDKIAPLIVAPTSIIVDCNYYFDDLDAFGTVVVNDENAREDIVVNGVVLGRDGIAIDVCGVDVTTEEISNTVNECGVGVITRRFTATDPDGRTTSATQTITFISNDPFWINNENPNDPNDDVVWPARNIEVTSCGADIDPDVTGRPELLNLDKCALPGVKYEDWIFNIVDGACFKVVRTWTVIDWCQQTNNTYVMWSFDQTIKVLDGVAPEFEAVADVSVCSYDASCEVEFIDLTAVATDNCTPNNELIYTWFVNLNYDASQTDPAKDYAGNGNDASGIYPVGTHRVVFTARDKCGNISSTSYLFTVANCKRPSPVCQNIVAELMAMNTGGVITGMIEIKADWFDVASFGTCGGDLRFSFSSNPDDTTRIFTCADLGVNQVNIWTTDVFGNQDFCTPTITIQDNFDVCDSGSSGIVAGKINASIVNSENSMEEVSVNLIDETSLNMVYTSQTGAYQFQNVEYGKDYTVRPEKDVEHINGVTTLDIILIQKHMLGSQKFDDAHKFIAADVDGNGRITSADIVEIRQLLMSKINKFNKNTSWRFIPSDYTFDPSKNPLDVDYPQSVTMSNLGYSATNVNFTGIKIGDVNQTARTDKGAGSRSVETRNFHIVDAAFQAGEVVEVPVRMSDLNTLHAYQFTMNYNVDALNLVNIKAGKLEISEEDYAEIDAENGVVTSVWGNINPVTINADEVLFTLVFDAKNNSTLSRSLNVNSDVTRALVYDANETEFNLGVNFRAQIADVADFVLEQNVPNPFTTETLVTFNMPAQSEGTFTVYDIAGKVIYTLNAEFNAGENQVKIQKSDLGAAGVFYYELKTDLGSATKKMILVN